MEAGLGLLYTFSCTRKPCDASLELTFNAFFPPAAVFVNAIQSYAMHRAHISQSVPKFMVNSCPSGLVTLFAAHSRARRAPTRSAPSHRSNHALARAALRQCQQALTR